jgi:hypothetical protein
MEIEEIDSEGLGLVEVVPVYETEAAVAQPLPSSTGHQSHQDDEPGIEEGAEEAFDNQEAVESNVSKKRRKVLSAKTMKKKRQPLRSSN